MKIEIKHTCENYDSFRANKVKSLFNPERSHVWEHTAELPIEEETWQIGLVVGASGTGKTSIGKQIGAGIYDLYSDWDKGKPIIDCIAPKENLNVATSALSAVGLGDVPAWLRPFNVLSNGEQFRAGLARLICERPDMVVVDEFTSVIDRQIAKVGAAALSRTWKRGTGRIVLLSCHYDIIEWLQPDWVYDTTEARFSRGCLRQRPELELKIHQISGSVFSRLFKRHYYLDLPLPIAAQYFLGEINGEPVCHLAVSPLFTANAYRATRLVVMPEWQGIGVGTKFLNSVCQFHLDGRGRKGHKFPTFFHTSHPQLCSALRNSSKWVQTNARLYGGNKKRSSSSIQKSEKQKIAAGYGGHFRAVQSFKYLGYDYCKDNR